MMCFFWFSCFCFCFFKGIEITLFNVASWLQAAAGNQDDIHYGEPFLMVLKRHFLNSGIQELKFELTL